MSTLEISKSGIKVWRDENGFCHRIDGPAFINSEGSKFWYKHGWRHREDGPAIVYFDGEKSYWLNNKRLSKEEWFEQLPQEQKIKMAFNLDQL